MRRIAIAVSAVVAAGLLAAAIALGSGGDSGDYLVRAYFDNGSFTVSGQDVRVGGANVGVIQSVDVALPGEKVSDKPGQEEKPGTAIVVLKITDPAYQDFRQDASCILRPQSLIGERYVDCQTTRAAGRSVEGAAGAAR